MSYAPFLEAIGLSPSTAAEGAPLLFEQGIAPTTPVDGEMWRDAAGFFIRHGGVTIGPLGAATPPAGANGQVQYYDSGAFGASANLVYDSTLATGGLTVANTTAAGVGAGALIVAGGGSFAKEVYVGVRTGSATNLAGFDASGKAMDVAVGAGLSLSAGTLTCTVTAALTDTQVGFGSVGNTLTGVPAFTYTAATGQLTLLADTANPLKLFSLGTTELDIGVANVFTGAGAFGALAIGYNNSVERGPAARNVAIGADNIIPAGVTNAVVLGKAITLPATASNSIVIGNGGGLGSNISDSVYIGSGTSTGNNSVMVGRSGSVAQNAVSIGRSALAAGTGSIAIGQASTAGGFADAVAIGRTATATQAGQIRLGAAGIHTQVSVPNTTASTSSTTGAMVVSGGLGVAGAIYCNDINAGGGLLGTPVTFIGSTAFSVGLYGTSGTGNSKFAAYSYMVCTGGSAQTAGFYGFTTATGGTPSRQIGLIGKSDAFSGTTSAIIGVYGGGDYSNSPNATYTALANKSAIGLMGVRTTSGVGNGYVTNIGIYAEASAATNNYAAFFAAGLVTSTDATNSTSSTTGSWTIAGGAGIAKDLFVGNQVHAGTATGITASTTQTQGQQPLTKEVNQISVCANANDVVTLPTAVAGERVTVINNGAQTLQIFPAAGAAINSGATNASITLAAGASIMFTSYSSTKWVTDGITGSVSATQVAFGSAANTITSSTNFQYYSDLTTGGIILFNNQESTTTSNGCMSIAGGLGIFKSLNVQGSIRTWATTASTSTTTGALRSSGGLGVAGDIYASVIFPQTAVRWGPLISGIPQAALPVDQTPGDGFFNIVSASSFKLIQFGSQSLNLLNTTVDTYFLRMMNTAHVGGGGVPRGTALAAAYTKATLSSLDGHLRINKNSVVFNANPSNIIAIQIEDGVASTSTVTGDIVVAGGIGIGGAGFFGGEVSATAAYRFLGTDAVVVGNLAATSGLIAVALGGGSTSARAPTATAIAAVAIGGSETGTNGARASGLASVAIGGADGAATGAYAEGPQAVAIGRGSHAGAAGNPGSVAIGFGSNVTSGGGGGGIAIGTSANNTSGGEAICLGYLSAVSGTYAMAFGRQSSATQLGSNALGAFSTSTHTQGVAIGNSAATTKANQIVLGNATNHTEITIPTTTATSSSTTGSLVTAGGIGASGNIYAAGSVNNFGSAATIAVTGSGISNLAVIRGTATSSSNDTSAAIYGRGDNTANGGTAYGVFGHGVNAGGDGTVVGVRGLAARTGSGAAGPSRAVAGQFTATTTTITVGKSSYAVLADVTATGASNAATVYAGSFTATGAATSPVAYGVYATATGAVLNYAGYFQGDTYIAGKLTVTGLIDPTGLALTPVAANPGGALAASTIWSNTVDSNKLYFGADALALVSSTVPTSRTVSTQYSLTGGGALSGDLTLNLVNDTASPGNFMTYGTDGSGVRGWRAGGANVPFIHVREEQTSGTAGGTFTSGSWQTRVLNTEVSDSDNLASVSSNQITLPAGTYEFRATAPHNGGLAALRVQDVTNSVTLGAGSSISSTAAGEPFGNAVSECVGRFTLAGSAAIEVQHQTSATKTTDGLGLAGSFGVNEIFAEIILRKVA